MIEGEDLLEAVEGGTRVRIHFTYIFTTTFTHVSHTYFTTTFTHVFATTFIKTTKTQKNIIKYKNKKKTS